MYSSSISDCTAYNEAYCDAGNGTPQRGFCLLLTSKVGRGRRVAPHPAYRFRSIAFSKSGLRACPLINFQPTRTHFNIKKAVLKFFHSYLICKTKQKTDLIIL